MSAKDSHIFPTKNNSVFVILMFEILTKPLTNDVVSFEQLGHGCYFYSLCMLIMRQAVILKNAHFLLSEAFAC